MYCVKMCRDFIFFPYQLYESLPKAFPRRFVFPLNVDDNTPSDQNLITIPTSLATAVKVSKDKVLWECFYSRAFVFRIC